MTPGLCKGCGSSGELIRGVCRNTRRIDPQPKLGCLRRAAQLDDEARVELHEWTRTRPRTPTEHVLLWRIRGVDKQGQGCYKPLGDLAVGRMKRGETPDPDQPKLSLRTARRAVSGLRVRKEVIFAGQVELGCNIWLDPRQRYSADKVPISKKRSLHHLWSLDDAKSLITGEIQEPQSLIIDGYTVNRKLYQEWNLDAIRRAIGVIKTWYPGLPKERIGSHTALLHSVLRQQLAGENAIYADRQSQEAKRRDARRLKEVADDLRVDRRKEDDPELKQGLSLLAQLLGSDKARQLVDDSRDAPSEQPIQTDRPTNSIAIEKVSPTLSPVPPVATPLTISQQIEDFLRCNSVEAKSQNTVRYYRDKAKALLLHYRGPAVDQTELCHLHDYVLVRRAAGVRTATIKKEMMVLSAVAKHFEIDLLAKSVRIRRFFAKLSGAATRQPKPLTIEEYEALRAELPDHRALLLDVAVFTGARSSELFALRIEDFDFVRGRVHIAGTKTARSDRWVPLFPVLAELVKPHQLARRGGPLVEFWHNKWKDLRAACLRAGIEPRSVLDFRHTFASWLKQAGCDSMAVGALLGHTTGHMVDQVYGHLDDRALRAVIGHLPRPKPKPGPHPAEFLESRLDPHPEQP